MKGVRFAVLGAVFVAGTASVSVAEDVCLTETSNLVGKRFVAKKLLYDTKVAVDGIKELEWDKEAIPEGAEFDVLEVICGGSTMKLKLRRVTEFKVDPVEIEFLFDRKARQQPDARANLEKIMGHVFAEPETKQ